MALEVERKFAVSERPPADSHIRYVSFFQQGYLTIGGDGSETRIRSKHTNDEGEWSLTTKSKGGLVRGEWETPLTEDQFNDLWPATEGRRLTKTRTAIEYEGHTIELDEYAGRLTGLLTVEVEFVNEQAAGDFKAPGWFGDELTEAGFMKNQNLALAEKAPFGEFVLGEGQVIYIPQHDTAS